jgi:hypothetical protein
MRPSSPIVFANAPATLVGVLSTAVTKYAPFLPILDGLFVTTDSPRAGSSLNPEKEAVLTVTGANYADNGASKEVGFNLNIYAGNFDDLVELGNALETVINTIKGGGVRYCAVEMPAIEVPEDDETTFHSFLTFTAVLGGKSLRL